MVRNITVIKYFHITSQTDAGHTLTLEWYLQNYCSTIIIMHWFYIEELTLFCCRATVYFAYFIESYV